MTFTQNKQLHTLLSQTNKMSNKGDLIAGITRGRSESSKDLTDKEAAELIQYLNSLAKPVAKLQTGTPEEKQRRKVIAIAHKMGWKLPNGKADMGRINAWCVNQFGKKRLNDYTTLELPKLVSIFEKVYKEFLKAV